MTPTIEYHVFPQGVGGWLVREGPEGPVVSRHMTRAQAVADARRRVVDHPSAARLVVHGLNGMVLHEAYDAAPATAPG